MDNSIERMIELNTTYDTEGKIDKSLSWVSSSPLTSILKPGDAFPKLNNQVRRPESKNNTQSFRNK